MRTSHLASILFAALTLVGAGCAKNKSSSATVPVEAPEFAEQDKADVETPNPASDGEKPIGPEDQVFFANDSDDLQPMGRQVLDDVAAWVKGNPDRQIVVQGHADKTGTAAHNLDLSARRAQAVGSYLKDLGVPSNQVVIAAVGEDESGLAPGPANRRVLIFASVVESASR
jgi:outer membrane protein OmpA-like peptidoglycan-associated protein